MSEMGYFVLSKLASSAVYVLSEVINVLEDGHMANDDQDTNFDSISSDLTEVEEFQSLTAPHITYVNSNSDEEDEAIIKFVDWTQTPGRISKEISSRAALVAVVKNGNVRFAQETFLGEGV